ncbi:MAG TPA: hypothetical protein VGD98_21355 [Ktedonobacteraceae bacterium]
MRRRSRLGGCLVGSVVILLSAGILGFVVVRIHNGVTIPVGAHPTIISTSCNGPVLIQAGAVNQVTITNSFFPQYTQDQATNTLEFTECDSGLTLTVPPEANLQMDVNDAITVLGVSGTMKLSANGSRITLEQVTLEGSSHIEDNGSAIVFAGQLSPGNSTTLSDNGGSIDVTLPANASLHLTVSGILGPITSNVPGVQNPGSLTGGGLQVNVGSTPAAATLTLDLNDTSVVFNKTA